MIQKDVAPGIHRLSHAYTNCYIVEDNGKLLLVDTGFPTTARLLKRAIRSLGYAFSAVEAIVLTHAHFDHIGSAARLHQELGAKVWLHVSDKYIAAHPYRYEHENARVWYPLRYPKTIKIQVSMIKAGALKVEGITDLSYLPTDGYADVTGRPKVIYTPGHTQGHCALHFEDRNAVITGDALVTLNPYTGGTGPQIVAGAATADSDEAISSLDQLAKLKADIVLPGHGEPWTGGIAAAVELAQKTGAS